MREQIVQGDIEIYQDKNKALPWISVHKEDLMVFIAHDPYSNETIVRVAERGQEVSVRTIGGAIHEAV
jgi:hypothetical protein